MAASKTIGGINVTITATIDKFRKTMTAAQRLLGGFVKAISKTVFSLKGLAVAMAAGAFSKFTVDAFKSIDALAKTADKLNISTEALAGFQEAAEDAGISNQTLERSLTMLAKKTGKNADVALLDMADAFEKAGSAQEQLTMATEMFGSRGSAMVRLLRGGRAALAEGAADAEKFGTAIDRASARGVERAIMAFGDLKTAIGGIFRNVAIEIAPFVEVISTKLSNFVAEGGKAKSIGSAIANAIISAAKFVADGIQKMVGAVMSFLADARQVIFLFRSSNFGAKFGVGYASDMEGREAGAAALSGLLNAAIFNDKKPWSTTIDSLMSGARSKAAQQAATAIDSGPGVLSRIANRTATSIADALRQKIATAQNSPFAMFAKLFGKAALFGAMNPQNGATSGMGSNASLMLAESGSVESYRQQAAIRRQGEQVQNKQLGVQQKMLAALNRIDTKTMPVFEANLV